MFALAIPDHRIVRGCQLGELLNVSSNMKLRIYVKIIRFPAGSSNSIVFLKRHVWLSKRQSEGRR